MTDNHFQDIQVFYGKLDRFPPPREAENPCAACIECCRYFFYCSWYEFQFIEHFVRQKAISISLVFKPAAAATEDTRLKGPSWLCPLHSGLGGCLTYPARPHACRVLGHYVPHTTRMPENCSFRNPLFYRVHKELPLWEDYVRLLLAHPPPDEFRKGGYFVGASADPLI